MSDPVEVTTLRLRGIGIIDKPSLPTVPERREGAPTRLGSRVVHLADGVQSVYSLYSREQLLAGDSIHGPAVITEHTATTVIHEGDLLTVGSYGELVVAIQADSSASPSESTLLEEVAR
jgi:N-methylhydantoinase A